ncbi:MAG: hypothetical protein ACOYI8_08150 [Christensenellales bacterium]|jgi:hypothetical protein
MRKEERIKTKHLYILLPARDVWSEPWRVTDRKSGGELGSLSFHGRETGGTVSLSLAVNTPYLEELLESVTEWAFWEKNVYTVSVATDDEIALSVLKKLRFKKAEDGVFLLEKPKSMYLALGMAAGLCVGMSVGAAVQNDLNMGIALGLLIGGGIGAVCDALEKRHRKQVKREKSI